MRRLVFQVLAQDMITMKELTIGMKGNDYMSLADASPDGRCSIVRGKLKNMFCILQRPRHRHYQSRTAILCVPPLIPCQPDPLNTDINQLNNVHAIHNTTQNGIVSLLPVQ